MTPARTRHRGPRWPTQTSPLAAAKTDQTRLPPVAEDGQRHRAVGGDSSTSPRLPTPVQMLPAGARPETEWIAALRQPVLRRDHPEGREGRIRIRPSPEVPIQ